MPYEFSSLNVGDIVLNGDPYEITESIYRSFVVDFADCSPIHVDEDFARSLGFKSKVMHGAIINGFVSHYVGVFFAGRNGFLLSTNIKYLEPNYLGDKIILESQIKSKSEATSVVEIILSIRNQTQSTLAARAAVQVKFINGKN